MYHNPKCLMHKEKGVKYCIECNQWYCNECLQSLHLQQYQHALIDSEVKVMCYEHNKCFNYYCEQCCSNLCSICYYKAIHINHYIILIDKVNTTMLIDSNDDLILRMLLNNMLHAERFLIRLNQDQCQHQHQHHYIDSNDNQMKIEVIKALKANQDINDLLRLFLSYIEYTAIVLKDYPCYQIAYLYKTIKVNYNEIEEVKEQFSHIGILITKSYSMLMNHLANNYILKQINQFECTIILKGHNDWIYSLIQLSHGLLASSSYDHTIKLWDINTSKCIKTLYGHEYAVNCLIELNNGYLVSGASDQTIKLWNISTFQCISTITSDESAIICLLQIYDKLLAGKSDNTIKIWSLKSNKAIKVIEAHNFEVKCLLLISASIFASGSIDTTIKLWDCNNDYNVLATLEGHSGSVNSLIKVNSDIIISSSEDETMREWDINTHQCVLTVKINLNCIVPISNRQFACGTDDGLIHLIDMKLFKNTKTLSVHQQSIQCLLLLQDGQLASVIDDNSIRIWNI